MFFRRVKQGVLQFVIIKPITSILTLILDHYKLYSEEEFNFRTGHLYVSVINNASVTISLYFLVLFYRASEERLKPFNPFAKFLCIKAILFFSFWQTTILNSFVILNFLEHKTAKSILNHALSFEMVFAALAQSYAFTYKEYLDIKKKKNSMFRTIGYVLNMKDVIHDAHNTFIKDKTRDEEERNKEIQVVMKEQAFSYSEDEAMLREEHEDTSS